MATRKHNGLGKYEGRTDYENLPNWARNKLEWQKKYNQSNTMTVGGRLNKETDAELIEIWKLIPNKNKLIKEAIIRYAKEELGMEIQHKHLEYVGDDEDDDR